MNKRRAYSLLGWLFALLLIWAGAYLWQARSGLGERIDTDLFALLPRAERDPQAEAAMAMLARQGERQLVILLEVRDAAHASQAAQIWRSAMAGAPVKLQGSGLTLESVRDFYRPYQQSLLTQADQQQLSQAAPDYWRNRAMMGAYSPFSAGGLAWQEDPFGLFGNWLQGLGDMTRVRPVGDVLMIESQGHQYAVLPYVLTQSAFDEACQQSVLQALQRAQAQVARIQVNKVLKAGIVLHAAAGMQSAQREMSIIGLGGMLGIFLLVVLIYRGWRAPLLIALSLSVGSLLATSVCFLLFPRVHVLTLVFGCSLVGVAVDYAIMALTHALNEESPPLQRYRRLLPGLSLALLTTGVAYLGLMLTPFPALAQMAVFATTGITAAWLSVMLWFPWLAPARQSPGPLARYFLRVSCPNWSLPRSLRPILLAGVLLFSACGLWQLQVRDDIRAMSGVNPALLQQQIELGRILSLASPAQMFLISGASEQAVLEREEALRERLEGFVLAGKLEGVDALSRWVPSHARQKALQQRLSERVLMQPGLLEQVADEVGLPADWAAKQRHPGALLELDSWLAAPVSMPFRHLWLGRDANGQYGSVILLKGLKSQQVAQALAQFAGQDVRWIDKPQEISGIMARYRLLLGGLLLGAYLITALGLYLRYRREVWRVLLPPALASVLTLALMGWCGEALQLLSMVSLLLVLGMGVDYGIFLQEQAQDRRGVLAMTLAALTALLSFGLLAFSQTPSLHVFGFAAMAGIGLSWLLALLCRRRHGTQA